jgi:hypothetical protein
MWWGKKKKPAEVSKIEKTPAEIFNDKVREALIERCATLIKTDILVQYHGAEVYNDTINAIDKFGTVIYEEDIGKVKKEYPKAQYRRYSYDSIQYRIRLEEISPEKLSEKLISSIGGLENVPEVK